MNIFKKIKEKTILNKKNEQVFYELALEEFLTGDKRLGLWAMALAKSDGEIEKANALYIGLLAEEIKNDEYLKLNKIQEVKRIEKLISIAREKESALAQRAIEKIQKEKEKEMKKQIDPRFKEPQPLLKRKH